MTAMRLTRYPDRLLVFGFATAIAVGTILLALPVSSVGRPVSLVDALFTATSAVCVTGLTVVDTGTTYSGFGQAVILLLIQVGGLGIMTLSTAVFILLGQRVSFLTSDVVHGSFVMNQRGGLGALLRRIFLWTIAIEAIGTGCLFLEESGRLPLGQALWYSVFHTISAFCNAGFGLRPDNLMSDRVNPGIVLPIAILIVLGGLGFVVLTELVDWLRYRRRRRITLSLHTKLALAMTVILLAIGMAGFAALERHNVLQGASLQDWLLTSFFASVTPRTAGFNTVNYGQLSAATLYMTIALMLIGGCPGSTAGGVKATTLGVILALARSRYHGEHGGVRLFNRSVPDGAVAKAIAVITLAGFIVITAVILFAASEASGVPHPKSVEWSLGLLFEVVSALCTVGLSTGITPELSSTGKIILVMLMFMGRLGPLTVAIAVSRQKPRAEFQYAEEPVMIG